MSVATLEKPKNRRRNGALLLPDPPPLLNGDHLTVPEFERRYWAMPEIKKAELKPRTDGVIRIRIFPGLWLDVRALLAGDEDKVSRVLEKGLRSAEPAAFVKRRAGAK